MSNSITSVFFQLKDFCLYALRGFPQPATSNQVCFNITSIAECPSYFYVGTTHGLFSKNKQDGSINHYTTKNSTLPSNWITSMLYTSLGQTYIGTKAGLVQRRNIGFQRIIEPNFIPADTCITALAEDKFGKIWIGNSHSVLVKSSLCKPVSYKAQPITIPGHQVNSLTADSTGLMWVGYTCGSFECFRNGLSYNYRSIRAIALSSLKGASPFMLMNDQEGAFICKENSIQRIAAWSSYPTCSCSYYNRNYSRMIICDGAKIHFYSIGEPHATPRSMLFSSFIRAISCQTPRRKMLNIVKLAQDIER